jgi:predicted Zn-dependent peptidase
VDAEALSRAKKVAILEYEDSLSRDEKIVNMASQVFATGQFKTSAELAALINKVTAADVQKVNHSIYSHESLSRIC